MPTRHFVLVALLALPGLAPAAEPSAHNRQKLYVTNSAGDDVTVIDVATNQRLGRIKVGPNPHGIAVPAAQDVIYVTIEGSKPGQLLAIDPFTEKIVKRIPVGPAPNQLAVTPDGKYAYVPCSDGYWDVVDLPNQHVAKRLFTGGRPHNTLCSPDGKRMYLAPMGSPKRVTIIDVATQEKIGEIPFSNVVRPIALTRDEKYFFAEVDGLVGIEMADIAARKMIHRVAAQLPDDQKRRASRSHGIGIRPDQKELWECDVEHHDVHIYDLTGDVPRQIATIPIGSQIYWLTFSPDGKTCYVSARGASAVAVVDTATKKIVARIPVGKEPKRLLVVTLPEKPQS
jgi:YVTN family beta-propeller protein